MEPQMPNKPLVAVVDDDQSIRETTKDLLESAGLNAAAFASAQAFLDSGVLPHVSCVIADMRMPAMSGLALHEHLLVSGTGVPMILITAYPDERVRMRAANTGVTAYLAKPFTGNEVLGWIRRAVCPA
jgi:FixJ family two-component response regulator